MMTEPETSQNPDPMPDESGVSQPHNTPIAAEGFGLVASESDDAPVRTTVSSGFGLVDDSPAPQSTDAFIEHDGPELVPPPESFS